jgi:sec-independent protein translocase protein TatB
MFNISGVELAVILLAALLLLGPQRLPELARGLGKFLREFRRQTDEVRTMVEREFYQMDQEIQKVADTVQKPVAAAADKPAFAGAEAPASPEATGANETILPASTIERAEPPPSSAASGVTDELYDAEYHAAEANGLIPGSIEARSNEPDGASGEPPAVAHPEDARSSEKPPSGDIQQETTPRAK